MEFFWVMVVVATNLNVLKFIELYTTKTQGYGTITFKNSQTPIIAAASGSNGLGIYSEALGTV